MDKLNNSGFHAKKGVDLWAFSRENNLKSAFPYILHPNNIGRCGHIANASYAVSSKSRGLHIGFRQLGTIPGGFLMKDGHYEDSARTTLISRHRKQDNLQKIPAGFRRNFFRVSRIFLHWEDLDSLAFRRENSLKSAFP